MFYSLNGGLRDCVPTHFSQQLAFHSAIESDRPGEWQSYDLPLENCILSSFALSAASDLFIDGFPTNG